MLAYARFPAFLVSLGDIGVVSYGLPSLCHQCLGGEDLVLPSLHLLSREASLTILTILHLETDIDINIRLEEWGRGITAAL